MRVKNKISASFNFLVSIAIEDRNKTGTANEVQTAERGVVFSTFGINLSWHGDLLSSCLVLLIG
jgi:hypothetical protein